MSDISFSDIKLIILDQKGIFGKDEANVAIRYATQAALRGKRLVLLRNPEDPVSGKTLEIRRRYIGENYPASDVLYVGASVAGIEAARNAEVVAVGLTDHDLLRAALLEKYPDLVVVNSFTDLIGHF